MSTQDESLDQVSFRLFDFTAPDENLQSAGLEPGFYYDVPMPVEDRSATDEVFVAGPYPTAEKARDAALAFIADALAEHKDAA